MTDEQSPKFEETFGVEDEPVRPKRRFNWKRPTKPSHPSLAGLVQSTVDDARELVEAQIELYKLKLKATLSKLGAAVALFAVAAVLGIYFIWWTFHTIEVAIAVALPAWAAALIVWGLLLVAIAVLALVGKRLMDRASEDAPDFKPVAEDLDTVKAAFDEGRNQWQ